MNPFWKTENPFQKSKTAPAETKAEEPPEEKKDGGLFGTSMKGGLFQKSTDLFDKPKTSAFGGKSLFDGKSNFSAWPGFTDPAKKAEEDKEEAEEATVIKAANDGSTKLFSEEVAKFTLLTGPIGSGTVSIQEKSGDNK